MVSRLSDSGGRIRLPWLLGGAIAEGIGIWSMHFTGMLALKLPVPVAYNVALTILSVVVATIGSLIALWLTQRPRLERAALLGGGLSIGAAISGLHYINMAAMRMPARTRYSAPLVIASIAIAIVFGLLGLVIGRRYREEDPRRPLIDKWIGAVILGLAIFGMHYTGMAAATFYSSAGPTDWIGGPALAASDLPQAVLVVTFVILVAALASAAADRRHYTSTRVSRRLLDAQENERRRIARLLHEDVGQLLTALRLNLERIDFSETDRVLAKASIGLLDEALSRVRALSVELRPSVLDDLGLGAAIDWYADRQAERAGYSIVVDQDAGIGRLPESIETAGFRIVQEALTNIVRHAKASSVEITLRRAEKAVELSITDDGIGFDVRGARLRSSAGESLGLLDMSELAKMAGGTISITSIDSGGSTVRVRFPVVSST
jgi:signal transduction histidine kinase